MQEFAQQLVNGLALGGIYALIALGYTMVYGVLRLINFAHGDVYMFGAFMGLYAAQWMRLVNDRYQVGGVAVLVILLAAMVSCAALGVLIERAAYRPLRNAPRLAALITAIGVSFLLENGGQLVFGTTPKLFPQFAGSQKPVLDVEGVVISGQDVFILVVTIVLLASLEFIVKRTRVGKAMRAVSEDKETASLMGINVDNIISLTFALGSAFAGAAGVLVAMRDPNIDPLMGLLPGIWAFVAAVLGGIGSIPGAVLGGFVIGITKVMVIGYWRSTLADAIVFGLLILILVARPTGLLGRGMVEKA